MASRVGQTTTGVSYRFGFNGKEADNEVKGWQNQQDYGMRIYDPRVGRFLSVDPITKEYPELTPYQFASNRPIDGIDFDGLEHTPATIGDGTARRDQTAVNMRADPKFETPPHQYNPYRSFTVPRNYKAFSTNLPPISDYAKQKQIANNERNWLEAGYNRDGSLTGAQKLMRNKYWINFDKNLATPLWTGYSLLSGAGETFVFLRSAALRREIGEALSRSVSSITKLDEEAVVGLRGSVATGVKYKTGTPFNPKDFDVDAFIVSDKLAASFNKGARFRDGQRIPELKIMSKELENYFKQYSGYRTDPKKTFTFRIFTVKEFETVVKSGGYKTF